MMDFSNIVNRVKLKISEVKPLEGYKVAKIFQCKKTQKTKVLFRISHERFTFPRYLLEVVNDDKFIDCLDGKTVRLLTHLATIEALAPELTIASLKESDIHFQQLVVKNNKNGSVNIFSADELASPDFIKKFNQIDAFKLGYFQAMAENNQEQNLRKGLKK